MAPFNWFRRKYEEPAEPSPSKAQETSERAEADESSPSESDPAALSAEERLKWAKAAYQNIQKRQAATAEPQVVPEADPEAVSEATSAPAASAEAIEAPAVQTEAESPAAPPEAADEADPSETPEVATAAEPAIADQSAIEEPATEPAVAEADVAEANRSEPEEITPTAATVTEAVPETAAAPDESSQAEPASAEAAPRPFWAQAQAEREARLERLEATAIAEPAPEPEPEPEPAAAPVLDIDLDDAFLWSAEVLAAQGRRPDQISVEEITWLNKLRQGLDKTRRGLVNQLRSIVGQGPLNDEAVMEIESLLLQADVGVAATDYIIESLQTQLRQETLPPEQAIQYLKSLLRDMLDAPLQGEHNLTFTPQKDTLSIWLMTGVNGAGKTTTIGKIAHIAKKSGFSCLIAAADTFRAAAVEQVKVWGQRSDVEVIANPGKNTDPAAVVFDAISAARSRQTELLLIDTAGRLQNKKNLMDELSKVRRIIDKKAPDADVQSLLVLDATLGQNGLRQAQVFSEAAQLSGVVLTKLDGTARGGVALAVVQQLGLPIRFIGAGEGIEDLRPFSSYEFVEALLSG
ncbi:signal recognition particle-docking protein FtsY [Romeria aff. gracilis LEGE 07310]|uniref:Signal recognition particle receptor FtsY n=1 Tax=Vasconcelosia minhoensis LEGE 07310 TaxID=915328 RepID=A0A8J7DQF7_9CYAN|nr:signal recognition particle-docking protein FtsY [Romeria gracilis]MBE9076489.1 signal recognition particle-docking protein FtsY [Romeria aff. gracilis LEGE 07310]